VRLHDELDWRDLMQQGQEFGCALASYSRQCFLTLLECDLDSGKEFSTKTIKYGMYINWCLCAVSALRCVAMATARSQSSVTMVSSSLPVQACAQCSTHQRSEHSLADSVQATRWTGWASSTTGATPRAASHTASSARGLPRARRRASRCAATASEPWDLLRSVVTQHYITTSLNDAQTNTHTHTHTHTHIHT
jgi:hypothetical protein